MNSLAMRCVRSATCMAMASLITACSAPKPPPPPPPLTEVDGTMTASTDLNPSVNRRPSPLLVRVYELKAPTAFNKADFVALYQRDQAELGAEMVAREELILNPGDSRPINKVAAPETRFFGVFAAYRDIDHAQWRSVLAIQPGKKQRITISARELSISADLAK